MTEKGRIPTKIKVSGKNTAPLRVQWSVESSRTGWIRSKERGLNIYPVPTPFPALSQTPVNTGVCTIPKLLVRKQVWEREVTHLTLQGWDLNPGLPDSEVPAFCTVLSPFQQSWEDLCQTSGRSGVQVQALRKLRFGWTRGWREVMLGGSITTNYSLEMVMSLVLWDRWDWSEWMFLIKANLCLLWLRLCFLDF